MQMLCSLTDGEKLDGKGMPNLDVKYLRGERDFKTLTNGRYVAANSLLILVDGENSGEVFRTPIEGYQGSTFKQLHINKNMLAEYILHVINLHRKALRENKVGSAIPHLDSKYPLIPTLWMIFEDSTFAFRSGDKHRSRRIYGK